MQNTNKRTDTRRTLGELGDLEVSANLRSPQNSENLGESKFGRTSSKVAENLTPQILGVKIPLKNDWILFVQFIAVGICIILVANLIIRVI